MICLIDIIIKILQFNALVFLLLQVEKADEAFAQAFIGNPAFEGINSYIETGARSSSGTGPGTSDRMGIRSAITPGKSDGRCASTVSGSRRVVRKKIQGDNSKLQRDILLLQKGNLIMEKRLLLLKLKKNKPVKLDKYTQTYQINHFPLSTVIPMNEPIEMLEFASL